MDAGLPGSEARQAICQKIGGVSEARGPRAERLTVPSPLQSTSKPCSRTIASMRGTWASASSAVSKKMWATVNRRSSAASGSRPSRSSLRRQVGRGRSTRRPLPSPSPSTLPDRWTIIPRDVRARSTISLLGLPSRVAKAARAQASCSIRSGRPLGGVVANGGGTVMRGPLGLGSGEHADAGPRGTGVRTASKPTWADIVNATSRAAQVGREGAEKRGGCRRPCSPTTSSPWWPRWPSARRWTDLSRPPEAHGARSLPEEAAVARFRASVPRRRRSARATRIRARLAIVVMALVVLGACWWVSPARTAIGLVGAGLFSLIAMRRSRRRTSRGLRTA